MNPEEIRKLLGGYATDTLTAEERRVLFEAALEDQELFNALSNEEALREYLSDPRFRRELLDALEPRENRGVFRWFGGPTTWALAGGLTVAALTVVMLRPTKPPASAIVTEVRRDALPAPPFINPQAAPPRQLAAPARKKAPRVNKAIEEPELTRRPADPSIGQSLGVASGSSDTVKVSPNSMGAQLQLSAGPRVEGRVTQVSASIVSLDIGTKNGVKVGDRLDIMRGLEKVGEAVITQVAEVSAVGRVAGDGAAQTGDRVVR